MTRQSSGNGSYRWVILGGAFLVQGISSMAVFSFGPLAPFLRDAFNITRVEIGLFSSSIFIGSVLFSLPAGWLIDRFGVRRMLLLGPGLFGLLFALFSQVPSVGIGYLVVSLAAISYAFVIPTTTMAIVHWFPLRSRATVVSIKQSALTVGAAVGAVIVPALSMWLAWRSTVAILGVVAVVVVATNFAIYRESISQPSEARVPALATLRLVLANSRLLHLGLVGAAYAAMQMAIASYLVLQLVEVRGLSAVVAGTFLMVTNFGGAAGRVLWGSISDRAFGGQRRPVLVIIGTISGAMAIVLSIGSATMPWWLLYCTVAVLGVTAIGWNGVFLTLATEISGKETAATSLGWALTIGNSGSVVGPPLFGYIVDRTLSYNPAWLVFGILVIVAAVSMMLTREHEASKVIAASQGS